MNDPNASPSCECAEVEGGVGGAEEEGCGRGRLCRRDSEGGRERLERLRAVEDVDVASSVVGAFGEVARVRRVGLGRRTLRFLRGRLGPLATDAGGGDLRVSARLIGSFNSSAMDLVPSSL